MLILGLLVGLAGCSAPLRPDLPTASPSPATVDVPAGGVSLRELGFVNGPVDAFSLPRTAVLRTRVDQASGVTVVVSDPVALELAAYLRRTLPQTGFTVTADNPRGAAMTFSGYGWHGSFTGQGRSSAVILRP